VASVELAREHIATRSDAAAYVSWLRGEQLFRDCLQDLRGALGRDHRGESGSDARPAQLPDRASDAGRSERLLESVRRLSSVLPPSVRGLWSLFLDETSDLVVGPGESLTEREWEGLTRAVRARLLDDLAGPAPDDGDISDEAFLERTLWKIDPAAPVLMPAAWVGASDLTVARGRFADGR